MTDDEELLEDEDELPVCKVCGDPLGDGAGDDLCAVCRADLGLPPLEVALDIDEDEDDDGEWSIFSGDPGEQEEDDPDSDWRGSGWESWQLGTTPWDDNEERDQL